MRGSRTYQWSAYWLCTGSPLAENYKEALEDYETALKMRPDMAWQIDPYGHCVCNIVAMLTTECLRRYIEDVREKIKARAALAEAEQMASLEEEEQQAASKASKKQVTTS